MLTIDFPGLIGASQQLIHHFKSEFFRHQPLHELRTETEVGVFNFQTDMDFIMDKQTLGLAHFPLIE